MPLKVEPHVYARRKERMRKLIELDAPTILIYYEAKLLGKATQPSLWYRARIWFMGLPVGYMVARWFNPTEF